LKRYDDLIRSCDVALGSGKPSAELYELRGVAKDAREDHPGAVADYTMALALQAGNSRLHRRRGWSYLAQEANRPAVTDFEEAIRLDSANADAYSGRGFARACLGHHSEAVSDAEEAMRRGESSWRIAYNSARIYARAATAAGSEARKIGPDAIHLVSRYHDNALAFIRVALQRATLENRSEVLSKLVATDPVFQPIRRRLRSIEGLRLVPE
jgi:tetratricopeptide (TPR) repeat protein